MKFCWDRFLKEGEELFNYMIHNFDDMFDGNKIKHFDIRYEYIYDEGTQEIKERYGEDIQKELIPWIKKEFESNELINSTSWKPFRDQYTLSDMYFGYRKLFQFKHYYFQLAMESECDLDDCKYCINDTNKIIFSPHFCLALYGWKDESSDILQPYNKVKIPLDNIMPESDWVYQ
jgi:hypothetical protein